MASNPLLRRQKYATTIGGIFMFFSLISTVTVQLGIPYDVPFETFTPTWIKSVSFAMNAPLPLPFSSTPPHPLSPPALPPQSQSLFFLSSSFYPSQASHRDGSGIRSKRLLTRRTRTSTPSALPAPSSTFQTGHSSRATLTSATATTPTSP
jgi:hypothetical protein